MLAAAQSVHEIVYSITTCIFIKHMLS